MNSKGSLHHVLNNSSLPTSIPLKETKYRRDHTVFVNGKDEKFILLDVTHSSLKIRRDRESPSNIHSNLVLSPLSETRSLNKTQKVIHKRALSSFGNYQR